MIAASKLKKAQEAALASRPMSKNFQQLLAVLHQSVEKASLPLLYARNK